jgi:hypothetical protein
MARIGLATSPLPRECSTTEPHGHALNPQKCQTGAGEGNRTLVVSLENFCSTIELHPQRPQTTKSPPMQRPLQAIAITPADQNHPLNCNAMPNTLVEGEGFEPSKAEPSDLQSDPFDRSGTPPKMQARNCLADPDRLSTEMNRTGRERRVQSISRHLLEKSPTSAAGRTETATAGARYRSASVPMRHNFDVHGARSRGKRPPDPTCTGVVRAICS